MSEAELPGREHYEAMRQLAGRFVRGDIDGKVFVDQFLDRRRLILDAEDDLERRWPVRYDLMLINDLQRGRLSADEFHRQWERLYHYSSSDPLVRLMGRLFTEVESYEPDWETYESLASEHPDWYFHEEAELRRRVRSLLEELGFGPLDKE